MSLGVRLTITGAVSLAFWAIAIGAFHAWPLLLLGLCVIGGIALVIGACFVWACLLSLLVVGICNLGSACVRTFRPTRRAA